MQSTAMIYDTPSLAEQVKDFLSAKNMSIEALASDISYARPTLSRYLSGKYSSNAIGVETALRKYLAQHNPDTALEAVPLFSKECPPAINRTDFFESIDARNIVGVCTACQKYARMGQIIGSSGTGKTYAAKHFSQMENVAYIRCNAIMGHRDLVREIGNALGIPKSYGSITERSMAIAKFFSINPGYLLIVDEADKLLNKNTQTKMDTLRDIYDNTSVGIVLVGERALKHLIACYLDRMENRIVYHYDLVGLSAKELDKYLNGYNIELEALAELQKRAFSDKKSCFRLLDTTLTNIFDLLSKTGSNLITLSIVRQASNWMTL